MTSAVELVQLTDTVHLARGDAVNWTLVTGDAGVMMIDAGYPGDRDDVLHSLARLGYGPADVCAILLTHAHIDHLGSAIWFAEQFHTPVYCHSAEVGHAHREYLEQASVFDVGTRLWRPRWATWSVHLVRKGGLIRDGIPTAAALTPEIAAGLPGNPRAVLTPGHTSGHSAYVVDGVLASGDALVTGHPLLRRRGPQLLPAMFTRDQQNCIRSLTTLADLDTRILSPGHGDVWDGTIREATEAALALVR